MEDKKAVTTARDDRWGAIFFWGFVIVTLVVFLLGVVATWGTELVMYGLDFSKQPVEFTVVGKRKTPVNGIFEYELLIENEDFVTGVLTYKSAKQQYESVEVADTLTIKMWVKGGELVPLGTAESLAYIVDTPGNSESTG